MKRKVLTDILKDYQELKFIYEYGFPWDDKLTKLLYDKSSQSTRRLALALEDNEVYKVEWGNYQEGAQNSKSDRKIVKKNTYSLRKNLWYQRMYKSYGKTDDVFSVGDEDDNSEGSILKKVYDFREFLCHVFISEETYKRLYEKVKDETKISFSEDILEIKDKVQDIRKSTVPKYRQIYQAVDKGKILCGIYKDQKRRLFPYALQYYSYVPESYERSKRNYPFEVMCYDMDSKRNILVTYDKINAKDISEKTILKFSDLDKIYHCLAVAIRYGIESESSKESREIEPPKMISKFLSTIWKLDHRSTSSIFHRKIRKQCMKFSNYHDQYEKLLNVCDTEAELGFVKMVFEYWDNEFVSNTSDNDLEKIYHTFLVKCFGEALKRYHSRAASVMKDVLDTIDDDFIWKMISGSSGNICNEIAFYNERLKHEKVYFSLKNPTLESIDKIYRLFSEFICTGEFLEDSSTIVFTITYEKFYYRKIHMYLMILKNIICDIGPESIHDIIEQRMNNIETIGDKLWNNNTFL